jgi:hypothetical protein
MHVVPPVCLKGFSPTVDMVNLQSPYVGSTEQTLDYSEPNFDKLNQLHPLRYLFDCHELVE